MQVGGVRPFTGIQRAEAQHISGLVNPFTGYGLAVPENEWPGKVPSFDTLAEACAAGVQAGIDNAELYDTLFGMADNKDLMQVVKGRDDSCRAPILRKESEVNVERGRGDGLKIIRRRRKVG